MSTRIQAERTAVRSRFPDGVASVKQLVALGVSERTAYKRCLDGGPWQHALPGILFLFTGRPTRGQVVHAALLLGGPDAVVTGREACRRHGLSRGMDRGPVDPLAEVHILVRDSRQVRSTGFVHVERTKRLPVPVAVRLDDVPLAPLPRACLDAARRMPDRGAVTELFADAVQRSLCRVNELGAELDAASRRGTAIPRSVLQDVRAGVRSAAEAQAKRLLRRSGLPEPRWNVRIVDTEGRLVGIADAWFDEVAMAWEIESMEWHLSPDAHARTVDRAADFVAAGAVYVASLPRKVVREPDAVLRMLIAAYEQARCRPRPPLRWEPDQRG